MKKCQDPLNKYIGEKCCLPTGKILSTEVSQCACKGSGSFGQCDNCVWTGLNKLYKDNTKKKQRVKGLMLTKILGKNEFRMPVWCLPSTGSSELLEPIW